MNLILFITNNLIPYAIIALKKSIVLSNNIQYISVDSDPSKMCGINSSFFTTIVSIFIFFLGFAINDTIRKHYKKDELFLYKNLFLEWANKSLDSLIKYETSLKEFANEIKTNESLNIPKWTSNLIYFSKLNSFPIEKIADTLAINLKVEDTEKARKKMFDLLYQIEFVEKNYVEIKDTYNLYCIKNAKIMDEWNKNYMLLYSKILSAKTSTSFTSAELYCFNNIEHLFAQILKKKENDVEISINEWSDKFIEPCMDYLNGKIYLIQNSKLIEITMLIINIRIVIIDHYALNKYGDVFDENLSHMEKAGNIIKESVDYFKKYSLKKTIHIK